MTPRAWSPNPVSLLTLRQFGLRREEIASLASTYAASQDQPTDASFVQFAYCASVAERQATEERIGPPRISLDWMPAKNVVADLLKMGYWPKIVEYARDEFIMLVREGAYQPISYEASFTQFLQQRWGLAAPNQTEWSPGRASQRFLGYSGLGGSVYAEGLTLFRQTAVGTAIGGMAHPDRLFCEFVLRWNGRPARLQQ